MVKDNKSIRKDIQEDMRKNVSDNISDNTEKTTDIQDVEKENGKLRQWHPVFCSAMKLELWEQNDILDYHSEYLLNTKPLQIDLLVIKKNSSQELNNEIGKLFRGHNILEYKSPDDELGVDEYYKVMAYACLYKAQGETEDSIKMEDVTVSFIRERKPRKLIHYLKNHGYVVEKKMPGLYYVSNKSQFRTQIVVGRELNRENHVWLHSLNRNPEQSQLQKLAGKMWRLQGKEERELADSVLSLVMQNTMRKINSVKGEDEMSKELWDFFKLEVDAAVAKATAEGESRGQIRGEIAGETRGKIAAYRELGLPETEIAQRMNLSVEEVRKIQTV